MVCKRRTELLVAEVLELELLQMLRVELMVSGQVMVVVLALGAQVDGQVVGGRHCCAPL